MDTENMPKMLDINSMRRK